MTLNKIQQLIGSISKSVKDNENVFTSILAVKLARCVEMYPQDKTIGSMSRVIEKMASNNTKYIKRSELKDLYNKLYSRNTKFAQLFQEELGSAPVELSTPTVYVRDEATEVNTSECGDQVLANALNSVFDKSTQLKMYSQPLADKAKKSVASTLDSWNLKPTSLEVNDGSDKFLVIKADYETPKGITSFYVPVEIHNNKVIEASIFMGNSGPQALNHLTIKEYLTKQAGSKLKITGTNILNVLTKASSEGREVSDAEIALIKLNSSRQSQSAFFEGSVVGQKVAEAAVKDVQLPKYNEFESFENKFTTPNGVASFQFGDVKVKTAKDHIVREILGFGYKNPQITVVACDDSTIFYGVALDAGRVAFTVPVKVANGKLNKPEIMICNGSMSQFNRVGINELYVNNQSDYKIAAVASPQFGLKPSDLVNNIREAILEGNHSKAEDALNILENSGDKLAYATGFQMFLSCLASTKEVKAQSTCSMIVKSSSSEHPVCGHTGLPIHKVYQDDGGNCRPLYRRGMDETYEGASFMNAKIFG